MKSLYMWTVEKIKSLSNKNCLAFFKYFFLFWWATIYFCLYINIYLPTLTYNSIHHFIYQSSLLCPLFLSSSCFPHGHTWKHSWSTGFLAHSSLSSAFCFHQWTTILHLCCVSKYLLAFLFLATPTNFSVFLCACLFECVVHMWTYT